MNEKYSCSSSCIGAIVVALLLVGLFGAAQAEAKAKYDFTYYEGYQQGLKAAQEANKQILLDFYFDT